MKMDDIVHLTFQTTKGTSELLKQLAEIQGIKQPILLDRICHDYINKTATKMINELESNGISIEKMLEVET